MRERHPKRRLQRTHTLARKPPKRRYCLLLDKIKKRRESMKKTQREKVRKIRSLFDLNDKNKDSIL